MTWQTLDAGVLRTFTEGFVRQAGVNRRLRTVQVMDDGVLRTVAEFVAPLSADINPTGASGSANNTSPVPVTTNQVTALPSGGRAPFTYAWAQILGSPATINNPSMATTSFTATPPPGETISATFQVTITDDTGQTATDTVLANFINFGGTGLS